MVWQDTYQYIGLLFKTTYFVWLCFCINEWLCSVLTSVMLLSWHLLLIRKQNYEHCWRPFFSVWGICNEANSVPAFSIPVRAWETFETLPGLMNKMILLSEKQCLGTRVLETWSSEWQVHETLSTDRQRPKPNHSHLAGRWGTMISVLILVGLVLSSESCQSNSLSYCLAHGSFACSSAAGIVSPSALQLLWCWFSIIKAAVLNTQESQDWTKVRFRKAWDILFIYLIYTSLLEPLLAPRTSGLWVPEGTGNQ